MNLFGYSLVWGDRIFTFFSPETIDKLNNLCQRLPIIKSNFIGETFQTLQKTLQLFAGRPSELALPLAYWISGNKPAQGTPMKPNKDGCGLIWYSPLVLMNPKIVSQYVAMVKAVCIKHKIEPLITLTSFSDRCFDSTVPILFDKNDKDAVARAHACYEELFETGKEMGVVPYRFSIHSMSKLKKYNAVPDILNQIKKVLDPKNILAPGRYLPRS